MSQPKTTVNPVFWPRQSEKGKGEKSSERTVKRSQIDSGEELSVSNEPAPSSPTKRGSKYTKRFEALPVGKCLKCSTDKASVVANAMRDWLRRTGQDGLAVTYVADYGDGMGRVWLVKKEVKSA